MQLGKWGSRQDQGLAGGQEEPGPIFRNVAVVRHAFEHRRNVLVLVTSQTTSNTGEVVDVTGMAVCIAKKIDHMLAGLVQAQNRERAIGVAVSLGGDRVAAAHSPNTLPDLGAAVVACVLGSAGTVDAAQVGAEHENGPSIVDGDIAVFVGLHRQKLRLMVLPLRRTPESIWLSAACSSGEMLVMSGTSTAFWSGISSSAAFILW